MKTAAKNIPENDPIRESATSMPAGNGADRDRAAIILKPRFRESSRKPGSNPPRKPRNADRRSREYLTHEEIARLQKSAESQGRHGHRDGTMILIGYRHAYRVSELIALRWDQINLVKGLLHVSRRKNGVPSTHPLHGSELRALRRLAREYPGCPYVFQSERKGPLTDSTIRKMIARAGEAADFPFPVHPHMLRHGTGFKLANDGQDTRAIQLYLGHKNISHTVRYTELSPERFKNFWND